MTQFQANRTSRLLLTIVFGILCTSARAEQPAQKLIRVHCLECHNDEHAEAKINLSRLTARPDFPRWFATWRKVATMVETGKMPPQGSKHCPQALGLTLIAIMLMLKSRLARSALRWLGDTAGKAPASA